MSEELQCPICGEPTLVYYGNPRKDRLCAKHGRMANNGEIAQCPDCGKWHNADKECECKKPVVKATNTDELTCIICGQPSNGKHFCLSCYKKYKDRSVDLRITHCKETKIIDDYGNLTYSCFDGRKVRSRAEAMISNWLYNENIRSIYEKTVYYEENGETKKLHPDFYLPDYGLYIEYNEITEKPYLKSKEYTAKIYASIGFKVLIMTEEDLQDIDSCLKPALRLH